MSLAEATDEPIDPARRVLGIRIRGYRTLRGLEQADIAAATHVSRALVSKWENGKSVPDALVLRSLCAVLGVTIDELLAPGTGQLALRTECQQPELALIHGTGRGAREVARQRRFLEMSRLQIVRPE